MMTAVRRIVLDVLKPHEPRLPAFASRMADTDGVAAARASLIELDAEVQNVELTLEGEDLDLGVVEAAVEELGGTVHSIDQVASGEYILERGGQPRDG